MIPISKEDGKANRITPPSVSKPDFTNAEECQQFYVALMQELTAIKSELIQHKTRLNKMEITSATIDVGGTPTLKDVVTYVV